MKSCHRDNNKPGSNLQEQRLASVPNEFEIPCLKSKNTPPPCSELEHALFKDVAFNMEDQRKKKRKRRRKKSQSLFDFETEMDRKQMKHDLSIALQQADYTKQVRVCRVK